MIEVTSELGTLPKNLNPERQPQVYTQNLQQAIDEFDKDIRLSPQSEAKLEEARNLLESGRLETAQSLLRDVLNEDSYHHPAISAMGRCLQRQGMYTNALICFQQLCKYAPSHANLFCLAETYYVLGKDAQALQAYHHALACVEDISANLFQIYKNLGNIYVRAGDFEAAEENYNKAYTINPSSDALLVNYGTLEIQRDHLDAAIERFRASIALNAANDRAWVGLALVHRHFGDLALAWANLEQAIDLQPENVTALHLCADWALKDGKIQRGIEHLQNYMARHGDDADSSVILARLFFSLGRLADAHIELERALTLNPESALVHNLRHDIVAAERERAK